VSTDLLQSLFGIFGSCTRGDVSEESDIDIVVELEKYTLR
jgi:predicted nucleotidyltransferase